MADQEAMKIRFMELKRELKRKVRLNRGRILKKTSIDRRLEKSILSKSETSMNSSIVKKQMLLALNKSLVDNVQRCRMENRDMLNKINEYEIRVCELELDCSCLKRENDKLKTRPKKANTCNCATWENKVAEMKTKCSELMDLFTIPSTVEPPIVDSSFNDGSSLDESAEDNLKISTNEDPDPNISLEEPLDAVVPEHAEEAAEVSPEAEKHTFKTVFNMTAITEEDLFTPNTSVIDESDRNMIESESHGSLIDESDRNMIESESHTSLIDESNRNFIESLPDDDSGKNLDEGFIEVKPAPRRVTFTVTNPLQTLASLTPQRLNRRRESSEVNIKLTSLVGNVMVEQDHVPKVPTPTQDHVPKVPIPTQVDVPKVPTPTQCELDRTKLNVEDMEFTATVDFPIITPATLASEGQPISPNLSIEEVAVIKKVADRRIPDMEAIPGCSKDYIEPLIQNSSPVMTKKRKNIFKKQKKTKIRKGEAAIGVIGAGDGNDVAKVICDAEVVNVEIVQRTPQSVLRVLSGNTDDVRKRNVEIRDRTEKENLDGEAKFKNALASPKTSLETRTIRQKKTVNYAEPSLNKKMRRT